MATSPIPKQSSECAARWPTRLGPIDILVINATCSQPELPFEQYDWEFFQSMLDFFVKSPVLLMKACLPHMKQQRWGRIVHITSEVVALAAAPFSAYVAAKGGQTGLALSTAREFAGSGITVNMVAPGWIPVERHANYSTESMDKYAAGVPAGRMGTPNDIAPTVVYLASEEARFVTGQTVSVNGGNTVLRGVLGESSLALTPTSSAEFVAWTARAATRCTKKPVGLVVESKRMPVSLIGLEVRHTLAAR